MLLCTDWPRLAIPQADTEEVLSGLTKRLVKSFNFLLGNGSLRGGLCAPAIGKFFVEWRKTRPRRFLASRSNRTVVELSLTVNLLLIRFVLRINHFWNLPRCLSDALTGLRP